MKIKNLIIISCLFVGLGLAMGIGCGSSSGGGTTDTLSNPPTGFTFTDENGTTVTSIAAGTTVQLRDATGNVLFAFTTNGNVDFSNVSAASSTTDTKALVHFPADTDKTGITGTVTLYVPCVSNQNSIVICPGATTVDEITTACTDAVTLSPATTTSGNYTYANAATRTGTTACQITADIANFGTGGVGNVTLPALSADDLPTTAPCGDQDLLTDATFIAAISTTTDDFRMLYDPAAICGFNDTFTGTHGAEAFIANDSGTCSNWANLYAAPAQGGTGIGFCGDDSNVNSLPKAGTYRQDFRGEKDGTIYNYRVRATVTGGDPDYTGQSYSDVFGTEDIASLIEYVDPAGNLITQDCTVQTVAGTYIPYPMQSFTVRKAGGGETLFSVVVEVICAQDVTP